MKNDKHIMGNDKHVFRARGAWAGPARIVAVLFFGAAIALAGETVWNSGSTEAKTVFAPNVMGQQRVTCIVATSDKGASLVKIYARSGLWTRATATANATATTIAVPEGHGLTTSDHVVMVHASGGQAHHTTLAGHADAAITLSAGSATATAIGDRVYKVTEQGRAVVGATSINLAGPLFITPTDSPLVAILDGTSACNLMVTVE